MDVAIKLSEKYIVIEKYFGAGEMELDPINQFFYSLASGGNRL